MNYIDTLRRKNPALNDFTDDAIIQALPEYSPNIFGGRSPDDVRAMAYQDNNALADLGRAAWSGAQSAAGHTVKGLEQWVGADWQTDDALLQAGERTMAKTDPLFQEQVASAGFREESENTAMGLLGAGVQGLSSVAVFAPVMAASAIAAPLTGSTSIPVGIGIIGGGVVNALLVGGSSYDETLNSIQSLTPEDVADSPLFAAYMEDEEARDPEGAFDRAKDRMAYDLASDSHTESSAIGGVSGMLVGPMLNRVISGGRGFIRGARQGAFTEGIQETGESGGEALTREMALSEATGRPVDWDIVGRDTAFGTTIGIGAGGTLGGTTGLLTPRRDSDPLADPRKEARDAIQQAEQDARDRGGDELDAAIAGAMTAVNVIPEAERLANTPDAIRHAITEAQTRLDELNRAATGTPDQTVQTPEGPRTYPGQQPRLLSDQEGAERDALGNEIASLNERLRTALGIVGTGDPSRATVSAPERDLTAADLGIAFPGQAAPVSAREATGADLGVTVPGIPPVDIRTTSEPMTRDQARDMTGLDGLITLADRMGFTDEAARLTVAKRLYVSADRLQAEGDTAQAQGRRERADAIYRSVTEGDASPVREYANQFPAPYAFSGEVVGGEVIPSTAPNFTMRDDADVDGRAIPVPTNLLEDQSRGRLGSEGMIYGQAPEPEAVPPFNRNEAVAQNIVNRMAQRPAGIGVDPGHQARQLTAEQARNADRDRIPDAVWAGVRGDGYPSEKAARAGIKNRERAAPELDWQPEQMPSGRWQVAGYARSEPVSEAGAALRGQRIDDEWVAFPPESGTTGISRAEMPQIKAGDRSAMVQFLRARGIDNVQDTVPADSLKPTQAEFSETKVATAKSFADGNRSILVSADGHILDGHHQWLASVDAGADVDIIRLNAPIGQLLDVVKQMPSVEVSTESATTAAPISDAEVARLTAERKRSEQAKARRRVKPDDSLVTAVIKLGGITTQWRQDITGDTKGNRNIPGVGALFSDKTGTSPDDMAVKLWEAGYITEEQLKDLDARDFLYNAIADELAGRKTTYALNSERAQLAELEALEEQYQAELDALEADREAMYAEIEAEHGADVAAQARAHDEAADNTNDQLIQDIEIHEQREAERDAILTDAAEAAGLEPVRGGHPEADRREGVEVGTAQENRGPQGAVVAGTEPAQAAPQGTVSASEGQEFALQQETESDRQAREQREAETGRAEDSERRRAERQEQAQREQAIDRRAATESVDRFELGQSAEQQLSGQTDLLGESDALYSGYEREASSLQSREHSETGIQEPAADTGRPDQFDLFAPPEADTRQAYADLFGTIVKPRPVARISSATDIIAEEADLAHLLASIRKDPQEVFYAVATDKDGKVLRVMRFTRGTKDAASVYALDVIAEAASIDGIDSLHFAHNHPSGVANPSRDDTAITDRIQSMLDGTGIAPGYHVVIGSGTWGSVHSDTGRSGGPGGRLQPRARTKTIPITERRITRRGTLGEAITSPMSAKRLTDSHDNAIFLLDTQNRPVAIIPMTAAEMSTLRGGGRVARVLSAINTSNASAAIVKSQSREAADNATRMLSTYGGGIRVLDGFYPDPARGGMIVSAAERGAIADSGPFFSLGGDRPRTADRSPVRNPHNADTLSAAMERAFPGVFSALEASGLARVITSDQLPDSIKDGKRSVSGINAPDALIESLSSIHPEVDAFLSISGDRIKLDMLKMPEAIRGQGIGSRFMETLTGYADEKGMIITLTAAGDFGGSMAGQQRFYKRHGFEMNKGRNKDFSISDNMIRQPLDARYSKGGSVLAYVQNGKVTFVADNIPKGHNLKGLMLHEIGVHLQQMGQNDQEFKRLQSQFKLMAKKKGSLAAEAMARVPKGTAEHLKVEEGLGYFVEQNSDLPFSQKVIAWFRAKIREWASNAKGRDRLKIVQWANNLSDSDIVYMATEAVRAAKDAGTIAQNDGVRASTAGEYGGEHRPMTDEGGAARLHDLEAAFGEDIYGPNALQYYGSGDPREKAVVRILKSLKGNPDAEVTIYRGGPESIDGINRGDWVTLIESVAQDYADQSDGGKVVKKTVKASEVTSWADSLLEFGYFPESESSETRSQPQTETAAFKKWFGDSKVVDADGKPLVVYHGTAADFDQFDPEAARSEGGEGSFFFARSPHTASTYAVPRNQGGNVVPVYLALKNPLITGVAGEPGPGASMDDWRAFVQEVERFNRSIDWEKRNYFEREIQRARDEGRDGVIFRYLEDDQTDIGRSEPTDVYVAFRPEQIKSATGNRGTFDPGNPSILYSLTESGQSRRDFLRKGAALAVGAAVGGRIFNLGGDVGLGRAKPIPEAVLDARVPEAVEATLRSASGMQGGKALQDALRIIEKTGPTDLRALAGQIAGLLPENAILEISNRMMNAHGAVTLSAEAPKVTLYDAEGRNGMTFGTIMHEAMHLAVLGRYHTLSRGMAMGNYDKLGLDKPAAEAALNQFRALWDEFRQSTLNAGIDATWMKVARGDPDEFFVRALTDPDLQLYLSQKRYQGQTLIERFKSWIKATLFASRGTAPSWLDAALLGANDLMEAMGQDAADYRVAGAYEQFSRKDDSANEVLFSRAEKESDNFGTFDPANPDSGALFQMAFHGTPHRFDRFSLEAIGTGEGAQAYGWGLYFAGKREIAEYYRETLSGKLSENAAAQVIERNKPAGSKTVAHKLLTAFQTVKHFNSDDLVKIGIEPENLGFEDANDEVSIRNIISSNFGAEDYIKNIDGVDVYQMRDGSVITDTDGELKALDGELGNLYQADIPEDSELLDWDAPLTEQPEKVRAALESVSDKLQKIVDRKNSVRDGLRIKLPEKMGNKPRYTLNDLKGKDIYGGLLPDSTDQRDVSISLNGIGIPGLRYLDGTSRRAGDGSRNYVIWDETRVTVEAVNDELRQAQRMAMPGAGTLNVQAVADDLTAAMEKLGIAEKVTLRLKDKIQAIVDGRAAQADGRYFNAIIEVSLSAPDARFTLNHEAIHALKDLGLFEDAEWRALERAVKGDAERMSGVRARYAGMGLSESQIVEEAIADLHGDWANGQHDAKGFIRAALERVRSFLEALGNVLRGNGFNSADSVFRAIGRGEVGRRQPRDAQGRFVSGTAESFSNPSISEKQTDTFSQRQPLGFYRELDNRVAQGPGSAMKDQWKGYINGLKQKGVKPDEIEWSGVLDWLDLQEGRVSREQVRTFLSENGVQVEEVTLGNSTAEFEVSRDPSQGGWRVRGRDGNWWGGYQSEAEARDAAGGDVRSNPTKYASYTVPGDSSNYREVLLTLPKKKNAPVDSGKSAATMLFERDMLDKYGGESFPSVYGKLNGSEIDRYEMLVREDRNAAKSESLIQERLNNYKSSHWDQPNVIAHVRTTDRVDADGNRVLFVEEVQSDWAQDGRKKGFKDRKSLQERRDELAVAMFDKPYSELTERQQQGVDRTVPDHKDSGIPRAPFITSTDKWVSLAIKRILTMAAEGGYDKVAFVNGAQAAEMFDLSKRISEVAVSANGDGSFSTSIKHLDGRTERLGDFDHEQLADNVGKDLADRIVADDAALTEARKAYRAAVKNGASEAEQDRLHAEMEKYPMVYTGLDLKVGGEGMRGFYDNILPKVLRNVTKRIGGELGSFSTGEQAVGEIDDFLASLGRSPVDEQITRSNVAVTITPEMREKITTEGLPMFSLREDAAPAETLASVADRVLARPERKTVLGKIRQAIKDKEENFGVWLKQGIVDQFASIADLETKVKGALLDASESAYKAAAFSKNTNTVLETAMHFGAVQYQDGSVVIKENSKGLMGILEPLAKGDLLREWEVWAGAVRAKRLLREGKERNYTAQDVAFVLSNVAGEKLALFEQVHREWTAYNKATLDFAEEAGLINQDQRAQWEKDDYVPFHRVSELGESNTQSGPAGRGGLSGQKSGIRKLEGGVEKISIVEAMVKNTAHMIDASMKNVAMQRTLKLAKEMDVVEEVKDARISEDEARQRLEAMGIEYDADSIKTWASLLERSDARLGTVTVSEKGKTKRYIVHDPLLLSAMTSLGPTGVDGIMKVLRIPKTLLTDLVTSDPSFALRNFIRDTLSTWAAVHAGRRNPISGAIKGVIQSYQNSDAQRAMMAQGVGGGGFYDTSPEGARAHLDRLAGKGKTITTMGDLWRAYRKVLGTTENANRIAVYEAALKGGASKAEAAYQAMDVLNFSRHGEFKAIRMIIQLVPFMNSRIQGLDKLWRGAKEGTESWHQINRNFMIKGAILTGATLALLAANWDEDDYWDLEEWERDTYYHFFINGEHYRIPKPFEVGAIFSTIPERLFEQFRSDADSKLLGKRMLHMIADTFAMDPTPQFVKPALEVSQNRNSFTGREILSMGMRFAAPEAQYSPYTSKTFIEIADAMPDSAPEWMRSPARLEHLFRGYFGTLGGYVLMGSDYAARAASGSPDRPESRLRDIPVVSSFIRDGVGTNKQVGRVYEMADAVGQINSAIKKYQEEGRTDKARDLQLTNREKLQARVQINRAVRQMSEISGRMKKIYDHPAMSPEMKRKQLDALIERRNTLAKQIAERYYDRF